MSRDVGDKYLTFHSLDARNLRSTEVRYNYPAHCDIGDKYSTFQSLNALNLQSTVYLGTFATSTSFTSFRNNRAVVLLHAYCMYMTLVRLLFYYY